MFLGLDLGTTNIKALVVDVDGRVVASGSAPVDRVQTADRGVEQNIEEIWDKTCAAVRQATAALDSSEIRAVGVSSQGAALQLLDARDKPIGPVISWLDARGRPFERRITEELGEDFFADHIGHRGSATVGGQILRLRQQAPDLLKMPNKIGFVGDFIVGRLCGRRAHDATSLSIAALLNPSLGRADPEWLGYLGIREEQLPELLSITTPAGSLGAEPARRIGLPEGIPVSTAVHDQYAATIGSGSVGEGDICLGTGTAWVLVANTGELGRPITPGAFVCPHAIEGLHGQLLSMGNGGSSLQWAMSLMGNARRSVEQIDQLLEAVPPGSDGLRFWPLLLPVGQRGEFSDTGGRMSGISLAHTGNHLCRAVVEGLGCELARHLGFLTDAGFSAGRLVMCGDAADSRVTPQVIADITGLPVARGSRPAVSAFGAAVVARALVEPDTGLADLARRLSSTRQTVHPGAHALMYGQLYQKYLEPFKTQGTGSTGS